MSSGLERLRTCFVCGCKLDDSGCGQPYPAVLVEISGNYGSTIYDPMPRDPPVVLLAAICDWCLCERQNQLLLPEGAQLPKCVTNESAVATNPLRHAAHLKLLEAREAHDKASFEVVVDQRFLVFRDYSAAE